MAFPLSFPLGFLVDFFNVVEAPPAWPLPPFFELKSLTNFLSCPISERRLLVLSTVDLSIISFNSSVSTLPSRSMRVCVSSLDFSTASVVNNFF